MLKTGRERRIAAFDGPADLARFFRGERLETIPASRVDRAAVLGHIARRFATDRAYDESEVNRILQAVHDDHATLRRYLVDERFLTRAGGRYTRA